MKIYLCFQTFSRLVLISKVKFGLLRGGGMAQCPPPNYAPVSTWLFTPDNAGKSQCLIILMVLVVSQNNKHYHSLTIMDIRSRTLETHTRQTEFYSDEEAWVSPVPRAVLVYLASRMYHISCLSHSYTFIFPLFNSDIIP